LRFVIPLARRAIEEDRIPTRFPDRSQLYAARSVQAEVDAARLSAPEQNPFCHLKGTWFELFLSANGFVDKVP
jgi:hypothetical protein